MKKTMGTMKKLAAFMAAASVAGSVVTGCDQHPRAAPHRRQDRSRRQMERRQGKQQEARSMWESFSRKQGLGEFLQRPGPGGREEGGPGFWDNL